MKQTLAGKTESRFAIVRRPGAHLVALALLAGWFGCAGDDGRRGDPADGGSVDGGGTGPDGGASRDGGYYGMDGRFGPDAGCASAVVVGDLTPANLLFVIDRSGSMNCNLPPTQTTEECENHPQKVDEDLPSKWEVTEKSLRDAFNALRKAGTPVSAGLVMFPVAPTLCDVSDKPDVPVARLNRKQTDAIADFLGGVDPGGDTPLAGATILSYAHILDRLRAGKLQGNSFVVLLTDGFETCKTDEIDKLLSEDVPNAHKLLNIRTFVIGAPGSEDARSLLSRIAYKGGTPSSAKCEHGSKPADEGDCHFDMTTTKDFAAGLAETLSEISGTVLSCELDVPTNPTGEGVDYDRVNVDVNDEPAYRTDCSDDGNDGWSYNEDKTKIVLCGSACEAAKMENARVSIVLGCPTRIL